jgi:hypothetical protein
METSPLPVKGAWEGKDIYRATPAVTWGLGFSGFIRRTTPFSRQLHKGYGEPTRILTGTHSVASYDTQGDVKNLF